MAAHSKRLIVLVALLAFWGGLQVSAGRQRPNAHRIVSLVPALTEILFAVGAGPQVVGVSSYDLFPPQVRQLPKVGALIDPDTERIFALRPDLVIVYGSQTEQQAQFDRAGIRTYSYRHGGIATILDTIRELGGVTGHGSESERVVRDLQTKLDAIRARVANRQRPRTLLVLDRQPNTLREVYASGGFGFLHEMLGIAGGINVFADVLQESVQPSHETLITRAPDVILEIRATGQVARPDAGETRRVWSTLPSLPAVRRGRIHLLTGDHLVVPGPRLAEGTEALARALHPEAF